MIDFLKSLEPWFPEVEKFDLDEINPKHAIIADRNGDLGLMLAGNIPEIAKFEYGCNTTWGIQLDTFKKAKKRLYCYHSQEVEERFPYQPAMNYGQLFAYGFYVENGKVTYIKRYYRRTSGVFILGTDDKGNLINTATEIDVHSRVAIKNDSLLDHIRKSGVEYSCLYRKEGNQGYVNVFG